MRNVPDFDNLTFIYNHKETTIAFAFKIKVKLVILCPNDVVKVAICVKLK